MHRISDDEWPNYFGSSMQPIDKGAEPPFDFWPYFDKIPIGDFEGFDCSPRQVDHAYHDASGRYEHVLISSENRNVFMAVVLDRKLHSVVGHHLLNLRELYGLDR